MSSSGQEVVLAYMESAQSFEWIRFEDLQDIEIEKLLAKSQLSIEDRKLLFDYHQVKFRIFWVLNHRTSLAKVYMKFLKKCAAKLDYSQLLELPLLTKENKFVDPKNIYHKLAWLQEDTNGPFIQIMDFI